MAAAAVGRSCYTLCSKSKLQTLGYLQAALGVGCEGRACCCARECMQAAVRACARVVQVRALLCRCVVRLLGCSALVASRHGPPYRGYRTDPPFGGVARRTPLSV
jgi:hypothetical protein